MPANETGLVKVIRVAILKAHPDAWVFKVSGTPYQVAGVPDLLVCIRGRLVGAEVKYRRPGESREHALSRVTIQQWGQIEKIRRAGGIADVVLSAAEALALIDRAVSQP